LFKEVGGSTRMTAVKNTAKENDFDLAKSKEVIGPLYPILVTEHGKIIDGYHRKQVDSQWPTQTLKIDEKQIPIVRAVANLQRRDIGDREKRKLLKNLAKATCWTSEEIAEKLGWSVEWVRKHLPAEFKDQKMRELAKRKHEKVGKPRIRRGYGKNSVRFAYSDCSCLECPHWRKNECAGGKRGEDS
jgi:hypothetical protein